MAYGADGAENFEISHVISRAFGAIGANFLLYFLLSAILSGLPAFGLAWGQSYLLNALGGSVNANLVFTANYWILLAATLVVRLVTDAVLQGALTRATVINLVGERPAFGPTLAIGISMMPATIAISLLRAFAIVLVMIVVMIPAVVLIAVTVWTSPLIPVVAVVLVCVAFVPAILLLLRWSIAVPAYVQERVGVFQSFGRSNRLTRGARGKIFLILLIIEVGAGVLLFFMRIFGSVGGTVVAAVVAGISAALTAMVASTIYASIYVELRDVKEGIEPHALETIFA